jgi:hypothetical protein
MSAAFQVIVEAPNATGTGAEIADTTHLGTDPFER